MPRTRSCGMRFGCVRPFGRYCLQKWCAAGALCRPYVCSLALNSGARAFPPQKKKHSSGLRRFQGGARSVSHRFPHQSERRLRVCSEVWGRPVDVFPTFARPPRVWLGIRTTR
eukprot:6609615-Lingulodinium_polyedra.AAC.1